MGGSSLCPEVLRADLRQTAGFPHLHVLDSTDPAQIRSVEKKIDLAKTLFIVSSKSGSTLEPNIFKQYFFERVKQTVGADKAGSRFIAITDPGSKMQQVAERDRFRHIFYGLPSIGGRYSALSNFGMVPAAVMGLDIDKFLDAHERNGRGLQAVRCRGKESGSHARPHPGHGRETRPRQSHAHHFARNCRSRRVARAVDRGIHRQTRQRHHPGRPRSAGRAGSLYPLLLRFIRRFSSSGTATTQPSTEPRPPLLPCRRAGRSARARRGDRRPARERGLG